MITITATDALSALGHIVETRGRDYVYHRPNGQGLCKYFANGAPSCGVGQALARLLVSDQVLQGLDTGSLGTSMGAHAMAPFLKEHGIEVSPQAIRIFYEFQTLQDQAMAWGVALDAAIHAARDSGDTQ